jgi:hypothetical protein
MHSPTNHQLEIQKTVYGIQAGRERTTREKESWGNISLARDRKIAIWAGGTGWYCGGYFSLDIRIVPGGVRLSVDAIMG